MEFQTINISFAVYQRKVERVGLFYSKAKQQNLNSASQYINGFGDYPAEGFNVNINYLKSLDPKEWKEHDHYAVLGLQMLRFNATDDDIRRAYKHMVLLHHPDKRKSKGEDVKTDEDYFTCITKAYEILGTPKTRRAYDSVDPEFDDSLPTSIEIEKNFYEIFNKYFNLNARWSEKSHVPSFGDCNSSREEVEKFYNFWYNFKSWRDFSYLDEEDKEKGQDRDERRWIEKENKAARMKRKKEEMVRIRALVDLAYNSDQRIQKFKNEEREKKLAAKRAKNDAAQAQKAEQERILKEAQFAKECAEKAEQKRIEKVRFEKEQVRKSLKKEKKILRDTSKECNYFGASNEDVLKNMENIEKICEKFSLLELQDLNKNIEIMGKTAFFAAVNKVEERIQNEQQASNSNKKSTKLSTIEVKDNIWNNEQIHLLIKAVNLFPAGTSQRWDVISSFINQHSSSSVNISSREALIKARSIQNGDYSKSSLKTQVNDTAFENFEKSKKDIQTCSDITVNSALDNLEKGQKLWTREEQILLEQAIKKYPISTPDRWQRISECIPDRSKKDCLRRVKELVELVNSKKEA